MFHTPAHKQLSVRAYPAQTVDNVDAGMFDHAIGRVAGLIGRQWGAVDAENLTRARVVEQELGERTHMEALRTAIVALAARVTPIRALFGEAIAAARQQGYECDIKYAFGDDYNGVQSMRDVLIVIGHDHELRVHRNGHVGAVEAV